MAMGATEWQASILEQQYSNESFKNRICDKIYYNTIVNFL